MLSMWEGKDLSSVDGLVINKDIADLRQYDGRAFYDKYKTNELALLTYLQNGGSFEALSPYYICNTAIANGHVKLFNYLLERKLINVSQVYSGKGAIDYAIEHDRAEIFKMLYMNDEVVKNNDTHQAYYKRLKLLEYPLLEHCPNLKYGFPINDLILSSSYSSILTKEVLEENLIDFFKKPLLQDILYTVAISASNRDLKMIFIDGMNEYDSAKKSAGFFKNFDNTIVISGNKPEILSKGVFMHEVTHKAMAVLFQNYEANPYKDSAQREQYINAIKEVFINIRDFFKDQYKLEVDFEANSTIHQMGKQLAHSYDLYKYSMVHLIKNQANEEVLNIFKNNPKLDVNSNEITALSGDTCIELAIKFGNFDLAKSLVQIGAKLNVESLGFIRSSLFEAIEKSNFELVKSIIEIKPQIRYTELELFKDLLSIAQYFNDKKIVNLLETYINDNNTWYNYFDSFIRYSEIELHENVKKHEQKENFFNAVHKLLNANLEVYKESSQEAEIAAGFIELIADGYYTGDVIEIVEPLTKYFKEVVHSEFLQYQYERDTSDFCLALPEENNIFINIDY